MKGALLYGPTAIEGWLMSERPLEEDEEIDNLFPGEVVRISTWTVIPAWTPIVVLGSGTYAALDHLRVLVGDKVAFVAQRDVETFFREPV